MPKYKKKFYRKKKRNRGGFSRNTSTQLSVMRSPVPRKFVTKMVYSEHGIQLNPSTGLATSYVFSANSLFDPNFTSGGHQPRGFDQFMAMYDHYVVLGAKIILRADNSANTPPVNLMIRIKDSTTTSVNPIDWLEDGYVRQSTIPGQSGGGMGTLTHSVNPAKFLGRSHPLSDPQLKGAVNLSPAEQAYFHLGAVSSNTTTDLNGVFINVQIEYIVAFIEPKQPTSS